jgi:hypothetical protein
MPKVERKTPRTKNRNGKDLMESIRSRDFYIIKRYKSTIIKRECLAAYPKYANTPEEQFMYRTIEELTHDIEHTNLILHGIDAHVGDTSIPLNYIREQICIHNRVKDSERRDPTIYENFFGHAKNSIEYLCVRIAWSEQG